MRVVTLHFARYCNEHQETEDETQGLWENSGSIHVAFCFYSCSSGTLELEMQKATSISSPNACLTAHPTTSATPDGTQRMFSVLKIQGSRSHARKTWYIPARKSPQNMIVYDSYKSLNLNHCNVSDIACKRSTPKKSGWKNAGNTVHHACLRHPRTESMQVACRKLWDTAMPEKISKSLMRVERNSGVLD